MRAEGEMTTEIDYYELLEVERTADGAAIKSAYRKLAMKYHPDKTGGCTDSEAKFKAVSEAYDCLKDPQKRAAYDRFGHAAFKQQQQGGGGGGFHGGAGGFSDLGDIFETIFGQAGFGGGGGGRQQQRRGADLRYDLEITLDEAYHGKKTEIQIEVSAACDSCEGSGAQPGTGVKTCGTCHGHGQVRKNRQLSLKVTSTSLRSLVGRMHGSEHEELRRRRLCDKEQIRTKHKQVRIFNADPLMYHFQKCKKHVPNTIEKIKISRRVTRLQMDQRRFEYKSPMAFDGPFCLFHRGSFFRCPS